MKSRILLSINYLFFTFCVSSQCPDDFFCSPEKDVVFFKDSIPICEDIFDGEKDGFTDYVEFLGCQNRHTWATRFYKKENLTNCEFSDFFNDYNNDDPYQTIFFDDFLNEKLDTTKWYWQDDLNPAFQEEPLCKNDEIKLRSPDNYFIKDGIIHFEVKKFDDPVEFDCKYLDGTSGRNKRKYSTCRITTFREKAWAGNEACFRFGRFSVRAKNPSKKGAEGSFWMLGWGAEIDIFEMCKPDCNEIQTNRYNYLPDPHSDLCDEKRGPLMSYPKDHKVGNIFKFREYMLEWTPHKLTWFVDKKPIRTFHRYWKIDKFPENRVCARPLDCGDLPENDEFEVWEHMGWWPLNHKLDIIIGCGINEGQGKPRYAEYIVDWVKIEQKTKAELKGPEVFCDSNIVEFSLENVDPSSINYWAVSSNLIVTDSFANSIKIKKNLLANPSEKAWVEVNFDHINSCYGVTLKKEITIGLPPEPEIQTDNSCTYIGMSILNFNEENNYDWEIFDQDIDPFIYHKGQSIDIPIESSNFEKIDFTLNIENKCGNVFFPFSERFLACSESTRLKIFPNPVTETVAVKFVNLEYSSLTSNAKLVIVDTSGKQVFNANITTYTYEIGVGFLSEGIYVVCFYLGDEVVASEKMAVIGRP